jgi:hypothetical protein
MKEKLKTLKDLTEEQLKVYKEMHERSHIRVFEARAKQEAIKWVKKLKADDTEDSWKLIGWIKHFFNITEEDLK